MAALLKFIPARRGGRKSSRVSSLSASQNSADETEQDNFNSGGSTSTNESTSPSAHKFFSSDAVKPWAPERFRCIRKLEDAKRNHGEVFLMQDQLSQKMVAVKRVPIDWACENHHDFVRKHPEEPEKIWVDIGCGAFLGQVSFPYACKLLGVYSDKTSQSGMIYMVSEYADGGDLFKWCSASGGLPPPGLDREALVRPIARQIFDSLRRIHDLGIVHGDVSLENLLLDSSRPATTPQAAINIPTDNGVPHVKLIDFGRASFRSRFRNCGVAKPSYKAPEMYQGKEYDGFLADAFAAGVVLYTLLTQEYPWLSTEKGADKAFDYNAEHGLRALLARKRPYRGKQTAILAMSDEAVELLEGLLAVDPNERLALGDGEVIDTTRSTVWQSRWLSS